MGTVQRWMVSYGIKRRSTKGMLKTPEHRQKLAEIKRGKWTGKDNPNWKGGITTQRPGTAYWRRSVKRRDNWICQLCGLDGKKICPTCGHKPEMHADHIKPWSQYPELRYELSNGRTLCPNCHRLLGKSGELLGTPEKENQQPS